MGESLLTGVPASGRMTVEADGVGRVLRLSGEIDAAAVAVFGEQQRGGGLEADPEAPLITAVDLSGVTFLSSAGLSFLIRATRCSRQAGQLPALRGLARQPRQVMRIAGVTGMFCSAA